MRLWIAMVAAGLSYSPNQAVSADQRVRQDSGPSNARVAQELEMPAPDYSPPPTPPPVSYLPGSIIWQSDGPPLVIQPGFAPIEGSFVGGPGISFGLGYPIGFIGGPR
jgi:hypothetical protein